MPEQKQPLPVAQAIAASTDSIELVQSNGVVEFASPVRIVGAAAAVGVPELDSRYVQIQGRWGFYVAPTGDATIDTPNLQAAIDASVAFAGGGNAFPPIYVNGSYRLNANIQWKSCDIIGIGTPNAACRIYWDGSTSIDAITRTLDTGGISFGRMENIELLPGTSEPAAWLDLTAGPVDIMFQLARIHFSGGTQCAIRLTRWVNLHWQHLRFDNIGGWAVLATPQSSQNMSTFLIDMFTYDHHRSADNLGQGLMKVDNTAAASQLGTVTWRGGRIELNAAWSGVKALLTMTAGASVNSRSIGWRMDDIAFTASTFGAGTSLLYRDTSNTSASEALLLTNVRQTGLAALLGGTWPATTIPPPLQGNTGVLSFNEGSGVTNIVQRALNTNLTYAAAIDTDASLSDVFSVTLTGNTTVNAPTNLTNGQTIEYRILQDATGSRTAAWASIFRFNAAFPSTMILSTPAGALDIVRFVYNSAAGKLECVGFYKSALSITGSSVPSGLYASGQWYRPVGVSVAAGAMTLNREEITPFYVADTTTFDQIECEVTTAAATATMRLGVSSTSTSGTFKGGPGAVLLDTGDVIDASTTGRKAVAVSLTLTPGLYWVRAVCHTAAVSVRQVTGPFGGIPVPSPSGSAQTNFASVYKWPSQTGAFATFANGNWVSDIGTSGAQVALHVA